MNLTVGQKVKVYDNIGQSLSVHDGSVMKIGRKLVTIQWDFGGFSPTDSVFRIEEGTENDNYEHRWFKTLEQAESDDRLAEARKVLRDADIPVGFRCVLTNSQIEELAAIVKNMLSEKPADYESEIAGR